MIPKPMEAYLRERLPERTFQNRLVRDGSKCFMEVGPLDVDHLARLGIEVDNLGPRLVVCMWDEDSPLEIGGYLVVDNLAMGRPSMGGIRMLPDVTPAAIHDLARQIDQPLTIRDLGIAQEAFEANLPKLVANAETNFFSLVSVAEELLALLGTRYADAGDH